MTRGRLQSRTSSRVNSAPKYTGVIRKNGAIRVNEDGLISMAYTDLNGKLIIVTQSEWVSATDQYAINPHDPRIKEAGLLLAEIPQIGAEKAQENQAKVDEFRRIHQELMSKGLETKEAQELSNAFVKGEMTKSQHDRYTEIMIGGIKIVEESEANSTSEPETDEIPDFGDEYEDEERD